MTLALAYASVCIQEARSEFYSGGQKLAFCALSLGAPPFGMESACQAPMSGLEAVTATSRDKGLIVQKGMGRAMRQAGAETAISMSAFHSSGPSGAVALLDL